MKNILILSLAFCALCIAGNAQDDPYLWLEEIESTKSLEFVNAQNKLTFERLDKVKEYKTIYAKSLEIYNSVDKIATPTIYGDFVYNFWKDKDHERGIWRRSPKPAYLSGKPVWEVLLDLDELSRKDDSKWVFSGASGLYPAYNRFLVSLSKGGGDAVFIKEFDVTKKSFIENGFAVDEAKGDASYIDENTVSISTDFGENTMTTSGYPRQARIWKRGSVLKDAKLIYESSPTDLGTWASELRDDDVPYLFVTCALTIFTSHSFVWIDNKAVKLDIPDDRDLGSLNLLKNQLVIILKSDWHVDGKTYKEGSLVSLNFTELIKGKKEIQLIFQPDEFTSVLEVSTTKDNLLVNILTNVKNELYNYSLTDGKWSKEKVKAPDFGTISITTTDKTSNLYFFSFENFLTPTTLYATNADDNSVKAYKSLPAYFDAGKYKVDQFKAKSADGTLIPYFVVSAKTMKYTGKNPTLIYAYGGFGVSEQPYYSGAIGNAWLENGGVYILANIRGGGEFGPKWHDAGVKEKRQNVYNDFHAVAEDVIARRITSSKNLGILGGSNGGLLVGVAFTQRPDLYNAVICAAPLLDMKRYSQLLAGASWMGEYGDPDKAEEWEYIKKYSPYQNVKSGVNYPEVLFMTSTKDDRVHPGHARKMTAKMIGMGYPVLFYENTEGGHAGASTNEQRAKANALMYSFLLTKLRYPDMSTPKN